MLKAGKIQAVGAMSGTSLDGVDVAVIETDGVDIAGFGPSAYHPYDPADQAVLKAALGLWPGPGLDPALEVVQRAHVSALSAMPGDVIGFHGQTLAHDPAGRGTHQLGDGQALASALDRPVVWDFRSADVAAGGQGAPLAPFYHFACARLIGATAPLVFLNLGGVGNVTWIDPDRPGADDLDALLAFDTGPANAPVNDLLFARRGQTYDHDGALARQGDVCEALCGSVLDAPYFSKPPPKSLDRDDFARLHDVVAELSDADAAATLCAIAAAAVAKGLACVPTPPERVLVCGGGRHNPVIMQMLQAAVSCPVAPVESVGLDGDMLEAQAFAYLAVRVARGLPTSSPSTTGAKRLVSGGRISSPH